MKRRGMVDMIYNEDYYLLLHTNYKRSGPFRIIKKIFLFFLFKVYEN